MLRADHSQDVQDLLDGNFTVSTDAEGDLDRAAITIEWADDREEVTGTLKASIDESDGNVAVSDYKTLEINQKNDRARHDDDRIGAR